MTPGAANLEFRDGIWYSRSKSPVHYPDKDRDICFQLEEKSFWFNHRNGCIAEIVKKFPFKGAIYDIGGGNGYVALQLQNLGFEAVLIEPGAGGVENAKKRGLKNLVCSSIEDAGFKKGSMDAIGIFDVLEHVEDDNGFLQRLNELLADPGRLYITVPAYKILWSNKDMAGGHFRRYSAKSLTKSLEKAGFRVEYATYLFSLLVVPMFVFLTLPSLMGFKMKNAKDEYESEHRVESKTLGFLISIMSKIELKMIRAGKRIPFGSSCLVVARKEAGHAA